MKQKIFTLILALTMLISCLPVSAAESISDGGSTYVTIEKGHYGSYLRTTDGNKIGARNWIYKTNDGITGPGYCVNYNLTAVDSSTRLTIAGLFTSSPQTAGAFASGYPQRTLDEFMEIYLADYPELAGLTENEFANATQFAIWATLGQLAIEGTDFTTGRSTIPVQYDNAQNVRIYRAIQIILNNAKNWDRIYKKGLSIRQGLSEGIR